MLREKFAILLILACISNNFPKDAKIKKNNNGFEAYLRFPQHQYIINEKNEIDFIFDEDESIPGKPKLPSKTFIFALPPESKVKIELVEKKITVIENVHPSLNKHTELINNHAIIYKSVERPFINYDSKIYPEDEYQIIGYTWLREYYCVLIKINTHRYSYIENKLFIIDTCKLKFTYQNEKEFIKNHEPLSLFEESLKQMITNYEEAKEYRTFYKNRIYKNENSIWIDFARDYIKVAIAKDNVYRIDYNYLLDHNINPAFINPKTIKVYLHGNEIPIHIKGEEDNQFNEDDYIEFYCEKNYSKKDYRKIVNKGEDYIHYMNIYSDTTFVWITWDGEHGKRLMIDDNLYSNIDDSLDYHLCKLHLEKDVRLWYYDPTEPRVQLPFWQENKLYTWQVVGNSGAISINFNASDYIENSYVNIIARMISYAANVSNSAGGLLNAHKYGISLNDNLIYDTITFNYKQTVNFTAHFNSEQLKDGENTIKISGLPTSASFHQSLIDWIDIEYFRKNIAVNDSLTIEVPDYFDKKLRVIKVKNIRADKNDIIVYKIYPTYKKFDNFIIENENLLLIDTLEGGYKYFITNTNNIDEPLFKYRKRFVNLSDKSNSAEYIIITNKLLIKSADEYKKFIINTYRLKTELVFEEDIYDQYSFGQVDAVAIKNFLLDAYLNWQPPKPSYLLIIGDANYDYKNVTYPAPLVRKKNLVTSFGNPVSDTWFVIWDSSNAALPQMYTGRIPANNDDEVFFYLQKHEKYILRRKDNFNKTFLFFTGGSTNNISELEAIKNVNDILYQKFVLSQPYFGIGTHFYKTLSPQTNYGPYSKNDFQRIIDEGSIFISYIGHSGTRAWDNGITEVEHIKNNYSDRFPLITDFGCSTGKFAEPDVDAFAELFICQSTNGQAIAYLGNSSWGYLSTSLRFPLYFYDFFIQEPNKSIGYIHLNSKIKQLKEHGFNDVIKVFTYCNFLFGDPLINLALPTKPNFYIDKSKIILPTNINDQQDSIQIKIVVNNYGTFFNDSLDIAYIDEFNNQIILNKVPVPKYEDTLLINIPVKNLAGEHKIKIQIDFYDRIEEIYEDDNQAEFHFFVHSSSLLPLLSDNYYGVVSDTLKLLNPIEKPDTNQLVLEIADNINLLNPIKIVKSFDTLITKISLSELNDNKRYYFRLKLNNNSNSYTKTYSFKKTKGDFEIFIDEPISNNNIQSAYIVYDTINKHWKLNKRTLSLIIRSAGWLDGSYGSILYDGNEQLPTTYYWGLAAAIIDSATLKPTSIRYFLVPDPGVMDSLTNFINSLQDGTLVAMTICADAQQSILGGKNSKSRNAIKKLGSIYIDSVQYRDSWCIIGKKGATVGSVHESYKKQLTGATKIEISKNVIYNSGYITFPVIKKAQSFKYIILETFKPGNSKFISIPLGIKAYGIIDTLNNFSTSSDTIFLDKIDTKLYDEIKLLVNFVSYTKNESPALKSLSVYYTPLPELACNYQMVMIDKDTIRYGDSVSYFAKIFNVGKSQASNFKITLQLKNNNNIITLLDTLINQLNPGDYVPIKFNYINNNKNNYGKYSFILLIDRESMLEELFENNNIMIKSFFIQKDTVTSVLHNNITVKFNNQEIQDGEYVDPKSFIQIEIDSYLTFEDTSLFKILLDNQLITFSELIKKGQIYHDMMRRKLILSFLHEFNPGEHSLRIFYFDHSINNSLIPLYERNFFVTSELEIKNVYNFPNPFNKETYFTFILTQIPDEIRIKIYSITGRLIKEIYVHEIEPVVNLYKIYWDGRDQDGNFVANGIYFYKVIVKKDYNYYSALQKFAIVR